MRRVAGFIVFLSLGNALGIPLVAQNEVEEALAEARRRLESGVDSPRLAAARARWAEYEVTIERECLRQEQAQTAGSLELDQAISRYETMSDLRATPVNHYLAGRILGMAGQLDQARAYFDRAITMDPYFYWAHHGLGTYYAMREMPEPASKHFNRALELNPEFVKAARGLALCLVAMGRLEDAEVSLRKILGRHPEDAETWWALGQLLTRAARYADALQVYQKLQQIQPARPELEAAMARCYAQADQVDKAVSILKGMLARNPTDYDAALELARIHQRIGQNHAAADYLQQALDNLPLQASQNRERMEEAVVNLRALPAVTVRDPRRKTPEEWVNLLRNSAEPERRLEAIRVLGSSPFRLPEIDAGILNALRDRDARVKTLAIKTVGRWWGEAGQLGNPRLISILAIMLKDRSPNVRAMAAHVLGQAGHPAAVPPLVDRLQERDPYVFGVIHKSLNRLTFAYVEVDPPADLDGGAMARMASQWQTWYSKNDFQYRKYEQTR